MEEEKLVKSQDNTKEQDAVPPATSAGSTPTDSPRSRPRSHSSTRSPSRSRSHSERRSSGSPQQSPISRTRHSRHSHSHSERASTSGDRASANYVKAKNAMSSPSKKAAAHGHANNSDPASPERKYSVAAQKFLNACAPKDARFLTAARMPSCTEPVTSETSFTHQHSSCRKESGGPYFSAYLSQSYANPGTEIAVAVIIIFVGLVTLLVAYITGTHVWAIVGYVCLGLGGFSMLLGVCWYCSKSNKDEDDDTDAEKESQHLVDMKSAEETDSRRHSMNSVQSPRPPKRSSSTRHSKRSYAGEAV